MISVAQGVSRAFVPSFGYITDTERDFEERIENRVIQASVHCLKIDSQRIRPHGLDRIPMELIIKR